MKNGKHYISIGIVSRQKHARDFWLNSHHFIPSGTLLASDR